jgi:alanine racemase
MSKVQETVLEIDLKALKHNLEYIKSKINNNTKILAVVKAFGYGSDVVKVAQYLELLKVDYLAVAYVKEGVTLRDSGIATPILVLHPQPVNFEILIENCLEPNLYTPRILNEFLEIAKKKNQDDYPIHIKFNTGLNRLGFVEDDVSYITNILSTAPQVKVKSIFSHLVASEDKNEKEFTLQQIRSFTDIAKKFIRKIGYKPMLHQLNTSGILNYPEAQFDMVRCGIGLYGFGNDPNFTKHLKLVASLKSVVSQVHLIQPNESVGYNRAYKANKFTKTATIPIGHADGIHRAFGNGNGYVTIKGKKAPIVGNVCMDMLMVNITDIDCNEGDEVVIFDNQETVNDLSQKINTISYEILTAISQRVKRIVK